MSEADLQLPRVVLDLAHASSVESIHEIFAAALLFPSYYGKNWDAFWDCITDPGQSSMPEVLVIRGLTTMETRFPRDAGIMKKCFSEMYRNEYEFTDSRPNAKPTKVLYE